MEFNVCLDNNRNQVLLYIWLEMKYIVKYLLLMNIFNGLCIFY